MESKKTVLFMQHQFREEQMKSLLHITGDAASDLIDMRFEASMTLASVEEAEHILEAFRLIEADILDVFGVIPAPLRTALFRRDWSGGELVVRVHEALNVNRAPDGEQRRFEFAGWLHTGSYRV